MELSNLNLTPTMKCNLKCQLCGVLVPHYNYRPEMTITEFCNTLESVFQIVDARYSRDIRNGNSLFNLIG